MKHRKLEEWTKARAVSNDRYEMARLLNLEPQSISKMLSYYGLPRFAPAQVHSVDCRDAIISRHRGGASLSVIAAEYNLTRGQVAGLLHRAGEFKKRAPRVLKPRKVRASYTTPRTPKFKRVAFKAAEAEIVPLNIPFLENTGCRWLYGDDPREMLACGHPTLGVFPYCESHCAIAYRAPEARERAPRPR